MQLSIDQIINEINLFAKDKHCWIILDSIQSLIDQENELSSLELINTLNDIRLSLHSSFIFSYSPDLVISHSEHYLYEMFIKPITTTILILSNNVSGHSKDVDGSLDIIAKSKTHTIKFKVMDTKVNFFLSFEIQ